VNLSDVSETQISPHWQMDGRVRIYIAPNCRTSANRIELSSGTRLADMRETTDLDHGFAYEEGARLPREPWRRPTEEEIKSLIVAEVPSDMATSVAVVSLLDAPSNDSLEVMRGFAKSHEANVLQSLRAICELGEPVQCIGPSNHPANLKTVTINHSIARYNGLHVDNWDQAGLYSRHLATNRVCFNIGHDDRYFLFLPISLMEITRLLAREMGPHWQASKRYTVIGRQFMERFPDVPIIRCRLAPGEGYIAPTENLVHDGSSVGQRNGDSAFTVRGHIKPL
jgi:hypothetical protein